MAVHNIHRTAFWFDPQMCIFWNSIEGHCENFSALLFQYNLNSWIKNIYFFHSNLFCCTTARDSDFIVAWMDKKHFATQQNMKSWKLARGCWNRKLQFEWVLLENDGFRSLTQQTTKLWIWKGKTLCVVQSSSALRFDRYSSYSFKFFHLSFITLAKWWKNLRRVKTIMPQW